MRINKIVLYNFNSYEGLNEFDFTSENPEKNIILIGGKNGAGKTSLFTAIKIALYGPLAFGYVGVNPRYIAKIKDCINSKAFQKDIVESSVQITIALMVEREIKEYEITRKWDFTKQKLDEQYYVRCEGELLGAQELSYFQNYLQGLVPPDLFEFFLFDGEEVGSIFSTSSYNTYVKNAIFTLCGLDIFEIIRKFTGGYAGKATTDDEEDLHREYESLKLQVEELETRKTEIEENISSNQEALEQTETELIEVETAFKNAGGITEVERKALVKEYEESERTKTESLTKIKLFVEDLMPFLIVQEFTDRITDQLDFEEKGEIYYYVQQKLRKAEIKDALGKKQDVSDDAIDALMEYLLKKFQPKGFKENTEPIHDLSREDLGRVNAIISSVENFDAEEMIKLVNMRKDAVDRTMEINKILKGAMADEDAGKFAEKENVLLKKKDELLSEIHAKKAEATQVMEKLTVLTQQRDKAFQNLKSSAQNKHVFELSSGLTNMMSGMLSNKTVSIKQNLERLIVENLQHIYRKNNLITHIEIDEDFGFNLYQNAIYTSSELAYLMRNLGKDVFSAEIGKQGLNDLFAAYKVDSLGDLQQALSEADKDEKIELFKRIDISRLSKGERQIFILSLYWAIIELSGQDIPFVIDTPYARIDANHRREISEKFFPNISKQVVILSTDEEINEEYYSIIKPYVAKQFLLINDESQNRTTVEQHYFFGV